MKFCKFICLLAGGMFLLGNHSYAQYVDTGTTVQSGSVVVGSGTGLGSLVSGDGTLSPTGFDNLTLNPGSMATGNGVDTIAFTTSNDTLLNNGAILGGYGGNNGLNAISFIAGGVSGELITNNGSATGGLGNGIGGDGLGNFTYFGGGGGAGGTGGNGIEFNSAGDINGIVLTNNGSATGGGGNGNGGASESDLVFIGGDGGTGAIGGNGIEFDSIGDISNIVLTNNGSATGGNGNGIGGDGGLGVIGGNGGNGGNGGVGGNGIEFNSGSDINGIVLMNNGSATGGDGSGSGGTGGEGAGVDGNPGVGAVGGDGILFNSGSSIANVLLVNNGSATGGAGGGGGAGGAGVGFIGGNATFNNITLVNNGRITGGNTDGGGNGGDGVDFFNNLASNLVVTNFGVITGGNGGSGNAGIGINSNSNTGGLTVNNWGVISAGSGANPFAATFGAGNNTLNLNGHSAVYGVIQGNSPNENNVLSLNFTGLSPAAISALKAQIIAQGNLNNFTGTFTVRGVTYNVDPMVIHLNLSSYQAQALTPSQAAIGANLDSLTYNPAPGTPFFNLLNAIDQSGNVPGALDQLSPGKFQVYGDLAIAASNFMVQTVDARLNNLRNGSESIDTSGIGGDTVAEIATDNSVAGLTKDDSKESKQIQTAAPAPKQWGFFATGDGLFFRGNRHDTDMQDDAKANTIGTLAGVDAKIGDHGVIGAFAAYNNSPVTLDNSSHATIQSYTGGIYGSWHDEGFYANGLAAYTRNNYKSERNILLPGFATTANGSASGNQASVNLDGGYDWNLTSRLAIGPTAGVQYVHLDINSFTESGASAGDLAVNGENMDSLQSRAGIHANYHLGTSPHSSFALDLHAAWQHEYLDDSRSIGASFEGTGLAPFAVQTASPLRDAAVVGLGLNFTVHDRLTLFTEYELELWRASYFEQTINGGARISF